MIKIFLVEDEIIVREGIKREIPWGKYGMELVGEAADGELAYPLIQQSKPDILLTDIQMPFMNGLELAELVRKEMPDIRIMFFSGYDDFEYAKKALQIGASDYLLKPISSEQLLAALKQMSEQIMQSRQEKEYMEQFRKELEEQRLWEREHLFDEIMYGDIGFPELVNKAKKYHIDLLAATYNIVLFRFQYLEQQSIDKSPSPCLAESVSQAQLNEVQERIKQELKSNSQIVGFDRFSEVMAFIIKGSDEESLKLVTDQWTAWLKKLMQDYNQQDYFSAVGIPVNRFSEIRKSYQAAEKAFAYQYFPNHTQGIPMDEIELINLDVSKLGKDIIEKFLKNGSIMDEEYFVDDFFESFGSNMDSLIFRQYILMNFYVAVIQYMTQIEIADAIITEKFKDIGQVVQASRTMEGSHLMAKELLKQALEIRDQTLNKKYRQLLEHAKQFMESNYQNEDISLGMVAAEVNLSRTHFSAIFSQEVGITFIEYLTTVRMNAAKHLLKTSDLRTSEIAYQVGYKDPHYFSYLFKKTQGMTPKGYRGGRK